MKGALDTWFLEQCRRSIYCIGMCKAVKVGKFKLLSRFHNILSFPLIQTILVIVSKWWLWEQWFNYSLHPHYLIHLLSSWKPFRLLPVTIYRYWPPGKQLLCTNDVYSHSKQITESGLIEILEKVSQQTDKTTKVTVSTPDVIRNTVDKHGGVLIRTFPDCLWYFFFFFIFQFNRRRVMDSDEDED